MKNIFETVCGIINEVAGMENIESRDMLKEDLGLDSLSLVEICVRLEDEFSIQFDSDNLNPNEILCVGDLVRLIGKTL